MGWENREKPGGNKHNETKANVIGMIYSVTKKKNRITRTHKNADCHKFPFSVKKIRLEEVISVCVINAANSILSTSDSLSFPAIQVGIFTDI